MVKGLMKVKPNMADDIVASNIFTRLPVKTLMRFTSACKSWYSLLYDPKFINMYNQIQKNKISNLLLLELWGNDDIVVTDSCLSEQSSSLSFKDTCNFSYTLVKLVGYCDGIVCVFSRSYAGDAIEHRINLWNPALRINKIALRINKIVGNWDREDAWASLCIGFGYNNKTNDYNIITFTNNTHTPKDVKIYSLALDSWRMIDQSGVNDHELVFGRNPGEQRGVYVSCRPGGAYCWTTLKRDQEGLFREDSILAFHMEDEVFKVMALPIYTTYPGDEIKLFIYKDSLAVFHSTEYFYCSSSMCDVWVMKEYDNPESWTKLCRFDSDCFFMGLIETKLIVMCYADKKVDVFDIDESQMNPASFTKDISFLKNIGLVSSVTESLVLLQGLQFIPRIEL